MREELRIAPPKRESRTFSRRSFLKGMRWTPLLFLPAPFYASALSPLPRGSQPRQDSAFPLADHRLIPHYPSQSPLEDVLRRVVPGTDEYLTEKYAFEIGSLLDAWSQKLREAAPALSVLAGFVTPSMQAISLTSFQATTLRSDGGIEIARRRFAGDLIPGRDRFFRGLETYFAQMRKVVTAEFQIVGIRERQDATHAVDLDIRYDFVGELSGSGREERIGHWKTRWAQDERGKWQISRWEAGEETLSRVRGSSFIEVTSQALGQTESYRGQMLRGVDSWRTILDGACGIDVYGNSGVAVGDIDNDGFDDFYVCQPPGLPNRLYRNRGDGTFEDVSRPSGVDVLDSTACALFADFENKGLQDLLVVGAAGPLLFLNQGNGRFARKRDAFKFVNQPQGTFTHAAIADYDRDGRLDIYFCLYSYYVGLDQYHYPVPYFDARNGPPNFLLHNEGNASFEDRTAGAGLNAENDRYSFACAWGDCNSDGWPDLYVANDFGRGNLYRNKGDGTFTAISAEAGVDDAGAGMSACWLDFDNDGNQDLYVADMWSAAGLRVLQQPEFHQKDSAAIREQYRRHARGNSLYRNQGGAKFKNVSQPGGVEMGRWAWSSDSWDFDQDGYPDLYIANGYISGPDKLDLSSFFWRQVVGKSPDNANPSMSYEHGWNAINELIRSDSSWNGYERNVLYLNNRDGTFSEVSGALGLDLPDDSRAFALADLDHDGRLEIILKNRNAPQVRILRNAMTGLGRSIGFRLRGTKSNRDAIGTAVTVEAGGHKQTKYLQAGSGFLSQHSKDLFFGLGAADGVRATIRWPSGSVQTFERLPAGHRIVVEEGSETYGSEPFSVTPQTYLGAGASAKEEPLPSPIETWLLEPLHAPEFSLSDLAGNVHELRSFRGEFLVLNFWVSGSPTCADQLRLFQQHGPSIAAGHLRVVAINGDDPLDAGAVRSYAAKERLTFPLLLATPEAAGIYNIIYRYLFDRHRDLGFPTSFLLDSEGRIIKVYQGVVDATHILEDMRSAPSTAVDRMRKALPMAGELYQDSFQRNDFTYGVALFQHGYLEQAASSFQQVISAKPLEPEAYYNLGTLYLRRHDLPDARKYLEQTVKLRQNYPEAWNNLGMLAAQEGKLEEAVRNFQQSLSQRPDYTVALLNLGNLYRRERDSDQAQRLLQRAVDLQPDDPEANYSLGMFYAQQDQSQLAGDYLQRAVSLRPNYPEALNNLGVLFVREQRYPEAEEQFTMCIRAAPNFDQGYLNLARLYVLLNDKEKAREVLQTLLRLDPQHKVARQALEMLQ